MNSETKSKSFRFPFFETLLVLLVVGLIAFGALSASNIVNYMALNTARELTQNSPINYMRNNVIAWFDTASEKSFSDDEINAKSTISAWYETKPINTIPATAIQTEEDKKPLYASAVLNGLPALKFDGSDDFMSITASNYITAKTPTCYNNFSIFLVAQSLANITINPESIDGKTGQTGQRYALFPPSGNSVYPKILKAVASSGISFGSNGISFYENASDDSTAPLLSSTLKYSSPVAILMEYKDKKPKLYVNNKLVRTGLTSSKDYVFPPFYIGGAPKPWSDYGNFSGYVGEVIIINRTLTSDEQKDVFSYLKKKWKLNY